jgi:hypothetical protein
MKIAMTREEFEAIEFDELIELMYENFDIITSEETLKSFAMDKLQDDDFGMALHIINAIYENPYDTEWYRYDYSMGTLETPEPITCNEDVDDLIVFKS